MSRRVFLDIAAVKYDRLEIIRLLFLFFAFASVPLLFFKFLRDSSIAYRLLLHSPVCRTVCSLSKIVIVDHVPTDLLTKCTLFGKKAEHHQLNTSFHIE